MGCPGILRDECIRKASVQDQPFRWCLAPPEGLVLYGSLPNTFVSKYPWTPHVVCSSLETLPRDTFPLANSLCVLLACSVSKKVSPAISCDGSRTTSAPRIFLN